MIDKILELVIIPPSITNKGRVINNAKDSENIRLKFVASLGKFENLDAFDAPVEFQSKINRDQDGPFENPRISPDDAFDGDDGVPF